MRSLCPGRSCCGSTADYDRCLLTAIPPLSPTAESRSICQFYVISCLICPSTCMCVQLYAVFPDLHVQYLVASLVFSILWSSEALLGYFVTTLALGIVQIWSLQVGRRSKINEGSVQQHCYDRLPWLIDQAGGILLALFLDLCTVQSLIAFSMQKTEGEGLVYFIMCMVSVSK